MKCLYSPSVFYRPQTKLREGNVFTPVCYSVHRVGCTPPVHTPETPLPWTPLPTWTHSPVTPGHPHPSTVNKRAERILLECFLVWQNKSRRTTHFKISLLPYELIRGRDRFFFTFGTFLAAGGGHLLLLTEETLHLPVPVDVAVWLEVPKCMCKKVTTPECWLFVAMGTYDPFTLHGTGTGTGTGERLVSILRYVLYTLHRDREPLFSIVPAPFFPVPVPAPCSHHAQMLECRQVGTGSTPPPKQFQTYSTWTSLYRNPLDLFKPFQIRRHCRRTPLLRHV